MEAFHLIYLMFWYCSSLTQNIPYWYDWSHFSRIDDGFELYGHTWCSYEASKQGKSSASVLIILVCLTSCLFGHFCNYFHFSQVVKKSLVTFVNKHLNKINLEVTELESQFSDGVSIWKRRKKLITWDLPTILRILFINILLGPGVPVSALRSLGRLLCAPLRLPPNTSGSLMLFWLIFHLETFIVKRLFTINCAFH